MGRGLRFQRICVLGMIGIAVLMALLRAQIVVDYHRVTELEAELESLTVSRPATPGDLPPGTIRVDVGGQSTFVSAVPGSKARRLEILREQNPLLERQHFVYNFVFQVAIFVLGISYFPLLVSVFLSTDASARAARLLSLCVMPIALLFVPFALNLVPDHLKPLILLGPLIVLAYPCLIVAVIWLVLRANGVRDFGLALCLLAFVPILLLCEPFLQYGLPGITVVQYGFWLLEMILVVGCTWPYLRADFS